MIKDFFFYLFLFAFHHGVLGSPFAFKCFTDETLSTVFEWECFVGVVIIKYWIDFVNAIPGALSVSVLTDQAEVKTIEMKYINFILKDNQV